MISLEDLTKIFEAKIREGEEGIWLVPANDAGKIGHMQGYRRGLREALDIITGAIEADAKEEIES